MTAAAGSPSLWLARGAIPVPASQRVHSIRLWGEFGVFGLSIYDDQHPWFILIEVLQIALHRRSAELEIFPGDPRDAHGNLAHEAFAYDVPINESLRHLLFRDREVARLASQPYTDPAALWNRWLDHARREFPSLDFRYLKSRFAEDFLQFAEALDLLRSSEIEKYSGRRWTSRHLLPLGPSMMFADVKNTARGFELDRRFFQRTGELVFLMLNRSAHRNEVAALLEERLLGVDLPWNRLARKIQPQSDQDVAAAPRVTSHQIGYLPILHMQVYDELARDWIALLGLRSLQIEDCLDALMRLTGLHEASYILGRAADEAGRDTVPPFPLDMTGTARSNPMHAWSSETYKTHKFMPTRAMEAFAARFSESDKWRRLDGGPTGKMRAASLLKDSFLWEPSRTGNPDNLSPPAEQLEAMLAESRKRSHSVGSALTSHARRIGLLWAQRSAGTWYSPQDGLLEALVLANVQGAMELGAFLRVLKDRYNIVVGPEEARDQRGGLPVQRAALSRNEQRFEERLRVLGFIDRKSDDCAFVVNPFYRQTRPASHAAA